MESADPAQRLLTSRLDKVIGGKAAKALGKEIGCHTVEQLLRYFPRKYAQRGVLTPLRDLYLEEHATVMARVVTCTNYEYKDKRAHNRRGTSVRTEVTVSDGSAELLLTFFRQPWITRTLKAGTLALFGGKVSRFRERLQLLHPDFEPVEDTENPAEGSARFGRSLIPIYPATRHLSSWSIQSCVAMVVDEVRAVAPQDPLPPEIRKEHCLIELSEAYEAIHRPNSEDDFERARTRFRYEEAFITQTVLAKRRAETEEMPAVARPPVVGGLLDRFDQGLPFTLTDGQVAVAHELTRDLARPHPMHRLLQGEVGSGKTVVALRAMLQVVDAGGQAALLAPTEVLAQQHQRSMTTMLGGTADATRVRLLTGSMGAAARRAAMLDIRLGAAGIIVGTHALLEDKVCFAELGLVVVDEQHRFGVEQRAALVSKAVGSRPHVLVMTATPIPRTVAMTVFGDLDTSTLAELPAGRQPIQTNVVPVVDRPGWLARTWERVGEEVAKGHQAYIVCPRISSDPDDPDDPGTSAVDDVHAELLAGPLIGLRVEIMHGRMTPEAKDDVMSRFVGGQVDVLVATTVIEVGVDVPNASVMVVMDADRFGVSQVHQLRGRVGRGGVPGLCLLVTMAPAGSPAERRLRAIAATTDGFELSRLDLRLRREGDVLGATQSGRRSTLQLLSVLEHESVIEQMRAAAIQAVAADPDLVSLPALARLVASLTDSEAGGFMEKA